MERGLSDNEDAYEVQTIVGTGVFQSECIRTLCLKGQSHLTNGTALFCYSQTNILIKGSSEHEQYKRFLKTENMRNFDLTS